MGSIFDRQVLHDLKKASYLMSEGSKKFDEARVEVDKEHWERAAFLINEGQKRYNEASVVIDDTFIRETRAKRVDEWRNSDKPEREGE